MSEQEPKPPPLAQALSDHSAEGVEILFAEPAPMIRLMLLLMVSLVTALLIWSFVGEADVIVAAYGELSPESDVRRVYSPAEGQLEGMLVREGQPVSVGGPLARVRSTRAIQLAAEARQAELELTSAELEAAQLPAVMALKEQQAQIIANDIEAKQAELDRRVVTGTSSLRQTQLAQLQQTRGALEQARNDREQARRKWTGYRDLRGEAYSDLEVEQARIEFEQASSRYQQADAALRALESKFVAESVQDRATLAQLRLDLETLRVEYDNMRMEIEQQPKAQAIKLAAAQARVDSARRIRFEGGADDDVLTLLSPVDGIVTQTAFDQAGDSVPANVPLVSIAPSGSRKVLKINIAESDRGFLLEGSEVKMKFNAFPYQQHGFIEGTLEYISPTTQRASAAETPAYKGHVSLDRDHFLVRNEEQQLRYGMTAVAEIIVRERRIIDMMLDPLRGM